MIEVVAGLIEDGGGRVLVCRRPMGKHLGGKWEFPGGKVEDGESEETALVRELEEELGIEVVVSGRLTPVVWDYGRGAIRLIPLRCRIESGEPHPHEHDAIEWTARDELEALEWAAADVPVVKEYLERNGGRLKGVRPAGGQDHLTE